MLRICTVCSQLRSVPWIRDHQTRVDVLNAQSAMAMLISSLAQFDIKTPEHGLHDIEIGAKRQSGDRSDVVTELLDDQ